MNNPKNAFNILKGKHLYQIFIGDYKNFIDQNASKPKGLKRLIPSGITKRWLKNSFGIMFIILLIIGILFSVIIREFFYSAIQQSMNGRSNELANTLRGYSDRQGYEFIRAARKYVEDFPDKKYIELTALDKMDRLIITSTGVESDEKQASRDCENARNSLTDASTWVGKLQSGEKVMTVTRALYNSSGSYIGCIRYAVSLERADLSIVGVIIMTTATGILIVLFVLISSLYFIMSIVSPVRQIGITAKKIAQGDFNTKISKKYDDEIGELCDTINHMATELNTSEKLKNEFISSVSHELRTPLTAIKGWAETMNMDLQSDPEMIHKGMGVIINESERLCGLVEELLDFSRMQNGKMILVMERIDVLAELTEAVYMFRDRAKSEEKKLLYTEPKSLSPIIGDKNKIKQVFINIIDNALKYTERFETIDVKISETEKMICIVVTDDGCGIPKAHLPRIKEKFYKANQMKRGSGIGLSVVDEIITFHRGNIDIRSEEGVGTIVEVSLPIADKIPNDK